MEKASSNTNTRINKFQKLFGSTLFGSRPAVMMESRLDSESEKYLAKIPNQNISVLFDENSSSTFIPRLSRKQYLNKLEKLNDINTPLIKDSKTQFLLIWIIDKLIFIVKNKVSKVKTWIFFLKLFYIFIFL